MSAALKALSAADARLKLLAVMLLGLAALRAAPLGLALFGAPLSVAVFLLGRANPPDRGMARAFLSFVLLWAAVKFGLDLWLGAPVDRAAAVAGALGLRLAVLLLLGLFLALSTSPRGLGLGLAALLRPLLGARAWRVALSMTLFVHFLPLVWRSMKTVRTAFALRGAGLPHGRKVLLFGQSLLRYWSQKAWKQTLALAARNLDDPAAWRASPPLVPAQWLTGGALAAAGWGLLIL